MMGGEIDAFIAKWQGASGGERSQSQSFLNDFCRALDLEEPRDGDYKFEFPVRGQDGTNFIDLYKRGCLGKKVSNSNSSSALRLSQFSLLVL